VGRDGDDVGNVGRVVPIPACPTCGECRLRGEIDSNLGLCPGCGHHYRVRARTRLEQLLDLDSFLEWDDELRPRDDLEFIDLLPYPQRLSDASRKSGLDEAVVTGSGRIEGQAVGIAVMDFGFIGGSMGVVVGEKVARAMERSASWAIPFVAVTASGGARMQEGLMSLIQMAKTSVVRSRLAEVPVPYISVLTNPTMGGVMASFAASADVILAEPGATIGFAGARVILQATHEELPPGFQTSEFMYDHGFIDLVVPRPHLRDQLSQLLALYPVPKAAFQAMTGQA
jgi:acetyl-CoA carboxylase carboxyl transferase subunit beta